MTRSQMLKKRIIIKSTYFKGVRAGLFPFYAADQVISKKDLEFFIAVNKEIKSGHTIAASVEIACLKTKYENREKRRQARLDKARKRAKWK